MRRLATLFAALALWCAATAASAAALDPETLRRDLIDGLRNGFSLYVPEGIQYGEVSTWAKGEAVRVRITKLAVPLADLPGRVNLGDMAFTVAAAGPGRYRVGEVRTDSQATFLDQQGREVALGNYRLERFSGVWSSVSAGFLELDFAAGGLEVLVPQGDFALALGRVTVKRRSSAAGAGGRIDQTTNLRAGPLRAMMPWYGTLEVAEIESSSEFAGMDPVASRALAEEMRKVRRRGQAPDRKQTAMLLDRLAELDVFPRRMLERFELRGISLVDPSRQPVFRLEGVEIDSAGRDLQTPLGQGSLGLRYGGLTAGSATGEGSLRQLVPNDAGFILSVERFPARALWRVILSAMANRVAAKTPNPDAKTLAPIVGSQLLTAAQEAGTAFRLERFHMESKSGRITGEGVITLGPAASTAATGRANFQIAGLDDMMAIALNAGGDQLGAAMFFMTLKSLARRETAADGGTVDHFDIELTGEGQILVNGRPAGMAGAPPAQ